MPHKKEMPVFAEGGFINDRSGQATQLMRQRLRDQAIRRRVGAQVSRSELKAMRRGNPAMRKFK